MVGRKLGTSKSSNRCEWMLDVDDVLLDMKHAALSLLTTRMGNWVGWNVNATGAVTLRDKLDMAPSSLACMTGGQ